MLHRPIRLIAGLLASGLLLASCDSTSPSTNDDIPPDPGTAPPAAAPTTGNYVPSALAIQAPSSSNPTRVRLTVGGTVAGLTYNTSNLTVVEDGVVQGIKISSGSGASLKADLAIIIDNTGSMGSGITSVKNSVLELVTALRNSGQDVQVGVVAYNDNGVNDGDATYTVPASDIASSAAVYGYRPLTSNLTTAGPIYDFVDNLPATGGGDTPELAFSGIDYARRYFNWRDGAQQVYILITDATSWGKNATSTSRGIDASYPWTDVTLGEQLRGDGAVLHCVCRNDATFLSTGEYNVRPLATATGGTFTTYSSSGFDLTTLPILTVTANTVLVEFLTGNPGTTHTVRVVVQAGANRGERTLTTSY